jgi:hypothetical protein
MYRRRCLRNSNDLLGPDSLLEDLEVEVPDGKASDDGEVLPIEVELEDRRLPPWRPGVPAVRPLAQAAFV